MSFRPTPQVFMIVSASARAVSVETSNRSLGHETIASWASVRALMSSAICCASSSVGAVQMFARS